MLIRIARCLFLIVSLSSFSKAAYLIEIDLDGLDDGEIEFNEDFEPNGGGSQSSASRAFGLSGADSIFGGEMYTYFYEPDDRVDNLILEADQVLGRGETASGLTGGSAGMYRVYATWPFTTNVSGGLTKFEISTSEELLEFELDQNGKGHDWIRIGDIAYEGGEIIVDQIPTDPTFVSMRSAGLMIELLPEEVPCEPNAGDLDGNGKVEFADFLTLSSNFGQAGLPEDGDTNCDGQIEFADFLALSGNFGKTLAAISVPEPDTPSYLLLLAFMGLASLRSHQRSH